MNEKPQKLQVVVLLQLITGILSILGVAVAIVVTCGMALLFLVPIYSLATGIMAVVSGAMGLGKNPRHGLYKTVAIMQIVAIISFDIPALVSGILGLVFLGDPNVQAFLEAKPDA
ncbi:MAG: hypothetical protein RBS80_19805 [Thermoguttaceae bacterium]|jgi:hypothetical protein|nr:hypothetical protein [Thermoguttaceae bacterium]